MMIGLLLIVTHLATFFFGQAAGRNFVTASFVAQVKKANAEVALGNYLVYRDIVIDLEAGNLRRAKCNAQLGASAMFDGVKECLADTRCNRNIGPAADKSAPEIKGGEKAPFEYLETKGGKKYCSQP